LRLTLLVASSVLVAVPFALLLLEVVFKGVLTARDERVAEQLNRLNLREDDAIEVARVVTRLGSTPVLAVIVLAVTVWLAVFHKRRRQALFLVVTAILGVMLNNILKVVVGRARPRFASGNVTAFGNSFPSGHAMNSTVVCTGAC
jgi:undecaprenyl-diphosphatase